jgi:hypothetical protein
VLEGTRECRLGGNSLAGDADTTLRQIASGDKEADRLRTPSRLHIDAGFIGLRFKRSPENLMKIQDLDSGGVKSKDTTQDLDSGGVTSKNTTQDESPIALRTRSKEQLQHPTEDMKQEVHIDKLQIENGLKELLNQLIIQSKKQQDEIKELNLTLAAVLEIQKNHQEKFDNIPIQSSISDQSDNQFMSRGQRNGNAHDDASNKHFDTTSLASRPKQQDTSDCSDKISDIESGIYMRAACEDTTKSINKMLQRGTSDDITLAKAFMVNPNKNDHKDESNDLDNSKDYGSASSSDVTQESAASDESLRTLNMSESISESSSIEDSRESDQPSPRKRGGYIVPKEPKKIRDGAQARLLEALKQVPVADHRAASFQVDLRTYTTLYVGNLDYNSNAYPLQNALRKTLREDFKNKIRLDRIDLPENHGKSKGYGFVTLSWHKAAKVKPSDICKMYSGMIDASARYVYFQMLRKGNSRVEKEIIAIKEEQKREQAKTVQSAPQPSPPVRMSGYRLVYM